MSMENVNATGNRLPFDAVPFDRVAVSSLADEIADGIEKHNLEIKAIADNTEAPDFQNTIAALDRSGRALEQTELILGNLEAALGSPELMEQMEKASPLMSAHSSEILLNEKLWERVRTVYEREAESPLLTGEQKRLLNETYRDFADNGALLEGEDREELKRINARLSALSVKFSQNVTNELSSPEKRLWVEAGEMEGFPADVKHAAREAASNVLTGEGKDDDGSYLFTMSAPSYVPFMKYQRNRALREKMYRMYGSRNTGGEHDNSEIVKEIANLRLAKARLMGSKTYSEHALKRTMAGRPSEVMKLLSDLARNYSAPMNHEISELQSFARKTEGGDFILKPWDYSHYFELLKKERFDFSDEDMKPYFELGATMQGVLNLATRLYGYTFAKTADVPGYHDDVTVYEVKDKECKTLGLLYVDLYYRDGKSPGAWMTEFRGESKDDSGKRTLPLISIVCNFPRPVGEKPVLLTPSEVRTLLHEFGHALHGLSAQAVYGSLSGTNVYRDFVELFSQFNENYLTEREFLNTFARHNVTGEPMPGDLMERFVKSGQLGAGYACMRQLGFGYLDMAYHNIESPLGDDFTVSQFEGEAQKPVRVFDMVEGCMTSTSFGHIFAGGYASGYYGYKWSEVLDADAFAAFREEGIFNKVTADRFKHMLEAGGTVDPTELYMQFRGKNPTVDALLERDGIKE